MNYTVFSGHTLGNSHKKIGMDCEDFSKHYGDPQGRFMIAVICDGHSDPKCFRSKDGARIGCETVVDILKNLFETYCVENKEKRSQDFQNRKEEILIRLRTAIVMEWNERVQKDLKERPILTDPGMQKLDTPQYRSAKEQYMQGRWLQHIYGATMLAVAACEDMYMVMQIGDGVVIRLKENGFYDIPIVADKADDLGGPASLCDDDLLIRDGAFRVSVFYEPVPQALFVTSDGIGDVPLSINLREHLCLLQKGLIERGEHREGLQEILKESAQGEFLKNFLEVYANRGVEDDCSLSGFYATDQTVQEVRFTQEEIKGLYKNLEDRKNECDSNYSRAVSQLKAVHEKVCQEIQNKQEQIYKLKTEIEKLEEKLNIDRQQYEDIEHTQTTIKKEYDAEQERINKQKKYVDTLRDRENEYSAEKSIVQSESDLSVKEQAVKLKNKPEPEMKPELLEKPETENKSESEARPEAESKSESEVKPEAKPEAEDKSETKVKPEPEMNPETANKSMSKMQSISFPQEWEAEREKLLKNLEKSEHLSEADSDNKDTIFDEEVKSEEPEMLFKNNEIEPPTNTPLEEPISEKTELQETKEEKKEAQV